jgi:hypothetical protein
VASDTLKYGPFGGQSPYSMIVDGNGVYRLAVDATTTPNTDPFAFNAGLDAFGRLRVSSPTSIFDSKQPYDNQPLLFDVFTANGGSVTYVQNKAASEVVSGLAANGRALRQTKRYLNYQPGKSQLIIITFNGNGFVENATKRIGYFDDDDGIFLQMTSSGPSAVVRSSTSGAPVEEVVPQADWNIDKMDGTGPSGLTIDFTKAQILVIDFEWLGAGTVRLGFDVGQSVVYFHAFEQANKNNGVYMQTPNLPVRWEVENTGVPPVAPLIESICCSVQSEGGLSPLSTTRSADRGITAKTGVSTTLVPLISIRLKAANNRETVLPLTSLATTTSSEDFRWSLLLNPTGLSGGSWVPVTNSPVEYNIAQTGTPAGGVQIASGYGVSGGPGASSSPPISQGTGLQNTVLALASTYSGVSDQLTLVVQTLTSPASADFYGSISWLEIL